MKQRGEESADLAEPAVPLVFLRALRCTRLVDRRRRQDNRLELHDLVVLQSQSGNIFADVTIRIIGAKNEWRLNRNMLVGRRCWNGLGTWLAAAAAPRVDPAAVWPSPRTSAAAQGIRSFGAKAPHR